MSPATTEKSFPFIVVNGPKVEDPRARRIIRKQAMKDVGDARRRKGNYGRVNMRQAPVFEKPSTDIPIRSTVNSSDSSREGSATVYLPSPDTTDSRDSTDATDYDEIIPRTRKFPVTELQAHESLSFAAISLFSNYETARAKFTIDVADLSILTNFNVGKSTIPILSADPMRLASLLGHEQWYVCLILNHMEEKADQLFPQVVPPVCAEPVRLKPLSNCSHQLSAWES